MPLFFLALKQLYEVFSFLISLFRLKEGLYFCEFHMNSLAHQQLEQDLGLEVEKNELQNVCKRRDGTWGDSQMDRGKKNIYFCPSPLSLLSGIQVTGISGLGISKLDQYICPDAVSGRGQYQYLQRRKMPWFWREVCAADLSYSHFTVTLIHSSCPSWAWLSLDMTTVVISLGH